jgi:ligand-binding sensor domain-containing protein
MTNLKIVMKMILLLSILTIIAFCNEENHNSSENRNKRTEVVIIGDTVSDIGKNIDCIFQDEDGNYWFASNGEGAYRYDGKTLTHITMKYGLCNDFVWKIQQDINGKLWFSTRDGFCCYDGIFFTDYTDKIKNAPNGKFQYQKGGLFFAHLKGVCFYDGKSFKNFVIHPDNYSPSPSDMIRPYDVYSTIIDKAGNAWFATQSKGVCRYDGKTFSYLTDRELAGPAVRTIYQDRKGILWFGNNGGGLYRYNGKTLSNITEDRDLGNPEFLKGHFNDKLGSLARVWTINEDKEGGLWVGTIDAGVWKYDGTNLIYYTIKDGLAGNSIWEICKDNTDELWFITNGEEICKFNENIFIKYSFH